MTGLIPRKYIRGTVFTRYLSRHCVAAELSIFVAHKPMPKWLIEPPTDSAVGETRPRKKRYDLYADAPRGLVATPGQRGDSSCAA